MTISGNKPESIPNAILIGMMRGMRENLGKGCQGLSNMIGVYCGEEIIRYAIDKGEIFNSIGDIISYFRKNRFAEIIETQEIENSIEISIEKCLICPKKIGGYKFDGTACPMPGLTIGALKYGLNNNLKSSARLTPGEKCIIILSKN